MQPYLRLGWLLAILGIRMNCAQARYKASLVYLSCGQTHARPEFEDSEAMGYYERGLRANCAHVYGLDVRFWHEREHVQFACAASFVVRRGTCSDG